MASQRPQRKYIAVLAVISVIYGALCAMAALCGLAFGIAANARKNAVELEAAGLRTQLAALSAKKTLDKTPAPPEATGTRTTRPGVHREEFLL